MTGAANLYSVPPYLVAMAFLMLLAATPLLRAADVPPNPRGERLSAFDGLRGFLALAVAFHHAVTYHLYISEGSWLIPDSATFYLLLGKFGVAGFFMITGYLFWSRIVSSKYQQDWAQLYIGRIFRICPLYYVALAAMLIFILLQVGMQWNVPPSKLAKQLARWLSVGLFRGYDLNGSNEAPVLLGMSWTLRFEWYFYFSLPILAFVARTLKSSLMICVPSLVISTAYIASSTSQSLFYTGLTYAEPIALFSVGMICASLSYKGITLRMTDSIGSLLAGILIVLAFVGDRYLHSAGEIILLGGAFYLIACGCSLFGLLTSRPARRLGNISYGIYLLQNLVFSTTFSVSMARTIALGSALGHWSIVVLSASLLILLSTVTHVWIERPGIEFGKRLGATVSSLKKTRTPFKPA